MKYLAAFVLAVAAAACWAGSDSAVNNDHPPVGPPPAVITASRPMPPAYDILLVKSIFADAKHRVTGASGSRGPGAGFVLRGVIHQKSEFTAYVEDTSSGRVLSVRPGDSVCGGKVTRISLGGVEYEAAGRRTAMTIGERFDGRLATAGATPGDAGREPRGG